MTRTVRVKVTREPGEQELNTQALGAFMGMIGEMHDQLEFINEAVNDHLCYSPDEIAWEHVSAALGILNKMKEVTDMIECSPR